MSIVAAFNDFTIRDLKFQNFIYKDEAFSSPLKLIDFGLSIVCKDGNRIHTAVGTQYFIVIFL